MNGGKKYVVISQEEYDRLKRTETINPIKKDMKKSEHEMNNVWEKDVPTDEKIRLFTDELNNMKRRYETLVKPKPLEVVMKNAETEESKQKTNVIEEGLLQTVPKASKHHAKVLMDYLKTKEDILKWNDFGEMIFKGQVIPGSNITDMIVDTVTNRKRNHINPMFKSVFLKALVESNVPTQWIKNKEHHEILNSYKTIKSKNPFQTPEKKMKWSSST